MFAFLWAIIKNILDKISSDHVRIIFDMHTVISFVEFPKIFWDRNFIEIWKC